jgi:hypothetical protein
MAANATSSSVTLTYNHPCKELVWVIRKDAVTTGDEPEPFNFEGNQGYHNDSFTNFKLQLNGHDRMKEREPEYYRVSCPRKAHSNIPNRHVYCYPFALKPEEWEPSGSCNFSRIDSATAKFTRPASAPAASLYMFCRSVNLMKVVSGMAGIRYAN